MGNVPFINIDKFQPALPMRGVTGGNPVFVSTTINFNPHSPCGE